MIRAINRESHLFDKFDTTIYRVIKFFPLLITVFVYFIVNNMVIKNIVGIAFVAYLLFVNEDIAFFSIVFLIPANELFTAFNGTSLLIIFMALYFVKSILFGKVLINNRTRFFFLFSLLLIIYSVFTFLYGYSGQLVNSIKFVLFMWYLLDFFSRHNTPQERLSIYHYSFVFSALGIIYIGFLAIIRNGFPLLSYRWSFSPEVTINAQGIICALTIINLLYYLFYLDGKKHLAFHILLILGCTFFGLVTLSRSFVLVLIVGISLMVVFSFVKPVFYKAIIVAGLAVIIAFILYESSDFVNNSVNAIITRFMVNDISNGRYDLWEQTIDYMMLKPFRYLFGVGDYTNVGIRALKSGSLLPAHNVFLETWVIYGFAGSFLILIFILSPEYSSCGFLLSFFKTIPLIVLLLSLFYSHHFIGRSMSIVLVLSILPLFFPNNFSGIKRK